MRIAVTGASGYIGAWLVKALRERGHEVATQDLAHGADALFDLGNRYTREAWLGTSEPRLVIHLAALYGRVWGERDLRKTAAVNAGLTAELARDCESLGIRMLYMSSSEVYGAAASQDGAVSEDVPLRPLNMYGLTKAWGEEACRTYNPDGLAIVRLNMPYGPAAILPQPDTIPKHSGRVGPRGYNALHTMLWQAHHGMPITVHKGTERCFTWIEDAIAGVVLIAESGLSGTWNCCRDDDHVPMADLAWQCQALAGSLSEVREVAPEGLVTARKRLDSSRLQALGWRPSVSLDKGMSATLRYVSLFDREGKWQG